MPLRCPHTSTAPSVRDGPSRRQPIYPLMLEIKLSSPLSQKLPNMPRQKRGQFQLF